MVYPICRDVLLLSQKAREATANDLGIGLSLLETLQANRAACVGMAANMIGVPKRIIAVSLGFADMVMYNPVITKREMPYTTQEGCLSLTGTRQTCRYRKIEVTFLNQRWQRQTMAFPDWPAQIIQHECDHLEGILI